jgi:hypothetical protein
VNTNFLDMLLK